MERRIGSSGRGEGRLGDGCLCCFQGYDIPAGHSLMMSPYWSHRDKEKFPEPEAFKPVQ